MMCVCPFFPQVAAAQEVVKEQLAAAAENIEVPSVEIPSNTDTCCHSQHVTYMLSQSTFSG
jgi:hypothetical protein